MTTWTRALDQESVDTAPPAPVPLQRGEPPASPSQRSLGLDVLRGLVVGWLLVVVYTPASGLRGHAAWFGWDHSDVFFPMFLLLAGMGLAMQTRRGIPWPRLLRRFVSLMLLGILVNAWLGAGADLSQLRALGVLQRIAIAGLIGAVIVALIGRRWWPALVAAVAAAVFWGAALAIASADCPGGLPTQDGCGTFYGLDVAAFGAGHVYGQGAHRHDPEGLASTAGAVATFLAGYAAAALLHTLRTRPAWVRSAWLLAMAAFWAVLLPAFVLLAQPVAKRLWTPSFVALHAALGIAVLAVAVLAFDAPRSRAGSLAARTLSWPLVALGRNALVLWVGVFVVSKVLATTPVGPEQVPLGTYLYDTYGDVGYFLLTAGLWWALAALMHLSRWYIRF